MVLILVMCREDYSVVGSALLNGLIEILHPTRDMILRQFFFRQTPTTSLGRTTEWDLDP